VTGYEGVDAHKITVIHASAEVWADTLLLMPEIKQGLLSAYRTDASRGSTPPATLDIRYELATHPRRFSVELEFEHRGVVELCPVKSIRVNTRARLDHQGDWTFVLSDSRGHYYPEVINTIDPLHWRGRRSPPTIHYDDPIFSRQYRRT